MLVLSRRRGESIIVGDDIEIRVLEVHGSQVKIGIEAPAQHTIHRKEVYVAMRENGDTHFKKRSRNDHASSGMHKSKRRFGNNGSRNSKGQPDVA